jgi:TonB family protein
MALVICSFLSGCGNIPPPIVSQSYSYGPNTVQPTKRVPIERPIACPGWYKDVTVKLAYTLEPDGSVSHIRVLDESHKGCDFAENAVFAFRQWKFPPYLENGVPVAHESTYDITFQTSDRFF